MATRRFGRENSLLLRRYHLMSRAPGIRLAAKWLGGDFAKAVPSEAIADGRHTESCKSVWG